MVALSLFFCKYYICACQLKQFKVEMMCLCILTLFTLKSFKHVMCFNILKREAILAVRNSDAVRGRSATNLLFRMQL